MCWSMEASFAVAAIGFTGTAICAKKKEHPFLWLTIFYFSCMEFLQAMTYIWIDQCSDPRNQILTLLGAYHIAFQPFFVTMISLYFVPENFRKKIQYPVLFTATVLCVMTLVSYYPFGWAEHSKTYMIFGEHLCAKSGDWHIAWFVPTFKPYDPIFGGTLVGTYVLGTIFLPLLFGAWKFTAYNYFFGYFLGWALTSTTNEGAAVWCLLSFAYVLVAAETKFKEKLRVHSWYGIKV